MRRRLIAVVIALAVLACAQIRNTDQAAAVQHQNSAAAGQLTSPPIPESDAPAIVPAAVSTTATAQTVLGIESGRQLAPAISVLTVSPHLPVVPRCAPQPRCFPLLI